MPYDDAFKSKSAAQPRPHAAALEDRKRLSLSGVEEVGSFDEREIVLRTSLGGLTVEGEGLSISRLDVEAGNVEVQGHVSALRYDEPEAGGRGRLFGLFH
ncbi:MAG: sporulation protein YabP [Oscillospiraceae bacterium]|nr:sporulation protein YabP [Oscillospiraceae bacterium]